MPAGDSKLPSPTVVARNLGEALLRVRARPLVLPPLVSVIGQWVVESVATIGDKLDFLGEAVLALGRMLRQRRRPDVDFMLALQEAGVDTLPIVALIAFAAGGILELLATQQLDKVAGISLLAPKVVAIVILREIGGLVTGIAMAGRLGAANAAELAILVQDGDDRVTGQPASVPADHFVAPRVLALVLMGPLLVTYANTLGLLGAMFVGVTLLDFPPIEHIASTQSALSFEHGISGLVKGAAFGFVVAMLGCYYGLRAGRRHGAVGDAVRAAVVNSVVWVVIADTVLTLFFKWTQL